ncbi:hypothetical protein EYC80_007593 [Monilinia laxa]|uniref:Uncharacterized protein n=1 Tax=Monilinia laxa TaxID=61186 RepID=A0A5N6JWE0_MONLA|nr:hypothetical protein EYC80_007593 [Monilinia laxa]
MVIDSRLNLNPTRHRDSPCSCATGETTLLHWCLTDIMAAQHMIDNERPHSVDKKIYSQCTFTAPFVLNLHNFDCHDFKLAEMPRKGSSTGIPLNVEEA